MKSTALVVAAWLAAFATPVAAHHPGERLDEVMALKEPAFEPTDIRDLPPLALLGTNGADFDLSQHVEGVVVLSFVSENCGATCDDQQALLQAVQEGVNVTPMREMVVFLTVSDTETQGSGWDAVNWRALAPADAPVTDAARAYATLSARPAATPMVHVLDRGGRHAGIFHGADFGRINMVLYVNGLTNAPPPEPGMLERLFGSFQ